MAWCTGIEALPHAHSTVQQLCYQIWLLLLRNVVDRSMNCLLLDRLLRLRRALLCLSVLVGGEARDLLILLRCDLCGLHRWWIDWLRLRSRLCLLLLLLWEKWALTNRRACIEASPQTHPFSCRSECPCLLSTP